MKEIPLLSGLENSNSIKFLEKEALNSYLSLKSLNSGIL